MSNSNRRRLSNFSDEMGWSIHSISPCYLGGSAGWLGTSAICAQHLQIPCLYKLIEVLSARTELLEPLLPLLLRLLSAVGAPKISLG
jgi:hypothetical protein